jgi:hypothetical protein
MSCGARRRIAGPVCCRFVVGPTAHSSSITAWGGSLWVHISGDAKFLWFCPDPGGSHPGFVPDGIWSGDRRDGRFLLVCGDEPDSIIVQWWQLLPVDAAYMAAVEYLQSPSPPASVRWFEL